jgi:hypothetical protein
MNGFNMIDEFIDWFDSLGDIEQIDQYLIQLLETSHTWFAGLSSNQQLLTILLTLVFLSLLRLSIIFVYRKFISIRRWYRRKRIPKNINLHLDKDR